MEYRLSQDLSVTDMDGQFHLAVNDYPVTLTVSYIGYETQTVKVSSSKSIVITMQSDNQVMDEVIVTGMVLLKNQRMQVQLLLSKQIK